jgi:hypothetical protein
MLPAHLAENVRKQVLYYLQSTFDLRARQPRSSRESVMDVSVYTSASSQSPTQRRFEPPPCPGTGAANGALRHRRASSIAPPPA